MADRPKSPEPSHLLRLPNELLMEICENLCAHCTATDCRQLERANQKHLCSLTLTCHRLRNIAQPFIFHIFLHNDANNFKPAESFLDTLRRRSDLAGQVRCVIIRTMFVEKPQSRLNRLLGSREDDEVGEPLGSIRNNQAQSAMSRYQTAAEDILSTCTGVQLLEIGTSTYGPSFQGDYERLKRLRICGLDAPLINRLMGDRAVTIAGQTSSADAVISRSPNLTELQLVCWVPSADWTAPLATTNRNVEKIWVHRVMDQAFQMRPGQLSMLIGGLRNLVDIEFTTAFIDGQGVNMLKELRLASDSLRRICITDPIPDIDLGDLMIFHHLSDLTLHGYFIAEKEVEADGYESRPGNWILPDLPRTLQSIELCDTDGGYGRGRNNHVFRPALRCIIGLSQITQEYPHLKEVIYPLTASTMTYDDRKIVLSLFASLKVPEIFASVGVTFSCYNKAWFSSDCCSVEDVYESCMDDWPVTGQVFFPFDDEDLISDFGESDDEDYED